MPPPTKLDVSDPLPSTLEKNDLDAGAGTDCLSSANCLAVDSSIRTRLRSVSFFFLDLVALGLVVVFTVVGGDVVSDDVVVCSGAALMLAGGVVDVLQSLSVSAVFLSMLSRFFWRTFLSLVSLRWQRKTSAPTVESEW